MKAIVANQYGSPKSLTLEDVPRPDIGANDVLVEVHASSVNAGDLHLLQGEQFAIRLMFGLTKPKHSILGADVAGRVEAVGQDVKKFKAGDDVFCDLSSCGYGGFAEYVSVPEQWLVPMPADTSYIEAAALPVGTVTALQGLRNKGNIQSGNNVLIIGASGGVGGFAVQIAKHFNTTVTGVCSTKKVDFVRSLGADHVIDYKKEDFKTNGQRYDLIVSVGGSNSIFDYKRALTATGTYVMIGGSPSQLYQTMLLGPLLMAASTRSYRNLFMTVNADDLAFIRELVEAKELRPDIDTIYSLQDVPSAIEYLQQGKAQGKIVIRLRP